MAAEGLGLHIRHMFADEMDRWVAMPDAAKVSRAYLETDVRSSLSQAEAIRLGDIYRSVVEACDDPLQPKKLTGVSYTKPDLRWHLIDSEGCWQDAENDPYWFDESREQATGIVVGEINWNHTL